MPQTAAEILHEARWLACLSQAQLAQRVGVSQQMIAQYEKGRREPGYARLVSLVAGCGVDLTVHLVPHPGLEDEPTLDLLGKPPLERLPERVRQVLIRFHTAAGGLSYLVGGKAAARMIGAFVRVHELELWFPDDVDLAHLAAALDACGADDGRGLGPRVVPDPRLDDLLSGWAIGGLSVPLYLRCVNEFPVMLERSAVLSIAGTDVDARYADSYDAVTWWHNRDYDRLALQRALRLTE
jgi:transcriptional regulator with XRE-family HTH domain